MWYDTQDKDILIFQHVELNWFSRCRKNSIPCPDHNTFYAVMITTLLLLLWWALTTECYYASIINSHFWNCMCIAIHCLQYNTRILHHHNCNISIFRYHDTTIQAKYICCWHRWCTKVTLFPQIMLAKRCMTYQKLCIIYIF